MEDFCQYNLFKKPQPNLFIPPPYARYSEGKGEQKKVPNLQLKASDPAKLFLLVESLQDNSSRDLEIKINTYLMAELKCQLVFQISLLAVPNEAFIRVIGKRILEVDIHMPASDQLILEILENKNGVQLALRVFSYPLFDLIKSIVPDITGTVYGFPIYERIHKHGISELTNNASTIVFILNSSFQKRFIAQLINETFRFCLPLTTDLIMFEEESRSKKQSLAMLAIARTLFNSLSDLDILVSNASTQIKALTDSERCFFYLLDEYHKKLDVYVFDGNDNARPLSVSKTYGIVGSVYTSGAISTIREPYSHPLFIKSDDEKMGFKTRNIICFPLRDEHGVIGVVMLCNKAIGDYNIFDEETVRMFGLYCGIAITNAWAFKRVNEIYSRSKISNEILMCHPKIKHTDIKHILYAQKPYYPELTDIKFNGRDVQLHHTPLVVLKMFEDLNFLNKFSIEKKALVKFIVYVQTGYGHQPFHNWMHSFAVTHFAYAAICSYDMIARKILTDLEVLSILIACLCQNIDNCCSSGIHLLGTINTLNRMFTSDGSINEKHHLSQTMCILNTEGCNFLFHLNQQDYTRCLELVKHNIFATNIATHLKELTKQEILLTKKFKPSILEHKMLFCSLIMTCSQLCDQTKGWKNARQVAALLHEEYFQQGDLDKAMGKEPIPVMDRDKASIPDLQVDFLRDTCLPAFRIFSNIFPEAQFCVDSIMQNITRWEASRKHFLFRELAETTSLEVLNDKALSFTESMLQATEAEGIEYN